MHKTIVTTTPVAAPTEAPVHIEILKTVVMFCGVGLTVSLLLMTYGLDLSPGFF
jgi:hypothetical protein